MRLGGMMPSSQLTWQRERVVSRLVVAKRKILCRRCGGSCAPKKPLQNNFWIPLDLCRTYYLSRESRRTFLVPPPPPGKNSTARNYSFQNQIRSTCRKLRRTFPVGYSTASQMRRQQQQRLPSDVAVVVIDAFESLLSISNHAAQLKTTRYDPSQQKWQLLSAWEHKNTS